MTGDASGLPNSPLPNRHGPRFTLNSFRSDRKTSSSVLVGSAGECASPLVPRGLDWGIGNSSSGFLWPAASCPLTVVSLLESPALTELELALGVFRSAPLARKVLRLPAS